MCRQPLRHLLQRLHRVFNFLKVFFILFSSLLIRGMWNPVAKIQREASLFPSGSSNFKYPEKLNFFDLFLPEYKNEPRGWIFSRGQKPQSKTMEYDGSWRVSGPRIFPCHLSSCPNFISSKSKYNSFCDSLFFKLANYQRLKLMQRTMKDKVIFYHLCLLP